MSINPDLRNQYTTLDAEQAKKKVDARCEDCGAGISRQGRRNTKRRCAPCSSIREEELRREHSRLSYQKRKAAKA